MPTIDYDKLFEQYYQCEYDFNTNSLTKDDVAEIKKFVKEKRVDYALAPIGTGIFNWIKTQNRNLRFELVEFDSDKIDGMLYIPTKGKERAYIILNSNKPLINQIFTAAHEYYHYEKDYQKFKVGPYICDLSALKDTSEVKACRFAAEILLPAGALSTEIQNYLRFMKADSLEELEFYDYATLFIFLTVTYQLPLKAVMYRLAEEGYIDNIDEYIKDYDFLKKILQEIKIFKKRVEELYSTENAYILSDRSTYQDMEKAFAMGDASLENILADAKKLNLDMELINDIFQEEVNFDLEDEDDDEELFSIINAKRG